MAFPPKKKTLSYKKITSVYRREKEKYKVTRLLVVVVVVTVVFVVVLYPCNSKKKQDSLPSPKLHLLPVFRFLRSLS